MDGTVECFTGGHAALAVFALLIVALYVIVIVLVAVIARGKLRVSSGYAYCKYTLITCIIDAYDS